MGDPTLLAPLLAPLTPAAPLAPLTPAGVLLSLTAGAVLGLVHFGGLWLTLLRLRSGKVPAAAMAAISQAARTAVTAAGMYLAMNGRWERLLACLAGFVIARLILMRGLGPARAPSEVSARPATGEEGERRP